MGGQWEWAWALAWTCQSGDGEGRDTTGPNWRLETRASHLYWDWAKPGQNLAERDKRTGKEQCTRIKPLRRGWRGSSQIGLTGGDSKVGRGERLATLTGLTELARESVTGYQQSTRANGHQREPTRGKREIFHHATTDIDDEGRQHGASTIRAIGTIFWRQMPGVQRLATT